MKANTLRSQGQDRGGTRHFLNPTAILLVLVVLLAGAVSLMFLVREQTPALAPSASVDRLQVTAPVCGSWEANAELQPDVALGGIESISALSSSDVWAVGNNTVWHWSGARWETVPTPLTNSAGYYQLLGVEAVSTNDVWIIGYSRTEYESRINTPLVWHWNGTQWSEEKLPEFNKPDDTIPTAIASSAPNDVWIVGTNGLVMHWDGTAWAQQLLGDPAERNMHLKSLVAIAENDVWAVGYIHEGDGPWLALTVHWDGEKWSMLPNPATENGSVLLEAVTAVAADDVWAAGNRSAEAGVTETFIMHWNGVEWKVVSSPNVSSQNYLYGLAALSANDVWAVGNRDTLSSEGKMLVLRWDGTSWSVVPVPKPMNNQNLSDVAAVALNEIWAVGGAQFNEDGGYYSMVARFVERECPK